MYEDPKDSGVSGLTIHECCDRQVPISMLMLSGSGTIRYLQNKQKEEDGGEGSFNFSSKATIAIIFGRVLLMPVIGKSKGHMF